MLAFPWDKKQHRTKPSLQLRPFETIMPRLLPPDTTRRLNKKEQDRTVAYLKSQTNERIPIRLNITDHKVQPGCLSPRGSDHFSKFDSGREPGSIRGVQVPAGSFAAQRKQG